MDKRPIQKTQGKSRKRTPSNLRFRTQFDPNYKGHGGTKNDKPSLTQPDMSLTVIELLENHTRGLHSDINVQSDGYYDTDIPQFDDITEFYEWKKQLRADLKAEQERLQALTSEKDKTPLDETPDTKIKDSEGNPTTKKENEP